MEYFDTFYENSNGDRHLFFTGRDNIIGLRHPEYSIKNSSKYNFIRLGYIYPDTTNLPSGYEVNVSEKFSLMTVGDDIHSLTVNITGKFVDGRVVSDSFKCTAITTDKYDTDIEIILTEQLVDVDESDKRYAVCIWLNSPDISYIFINRDISRSDNSMTVNAHCFTAGYFTYFLHNDELSSVTGMNTGVTIYDSAIADMVNVFKPLNDRVEVLENKMAVPKFLSCIVNYDQSFIPDKSEIGYQIVRPYNFLYDFSNVPMFMNISLDTQYISVKEAGLYSLQLSTGINADGILEEGESFNIELALYVNDRQIVPASIRKVIRYKEEEMYASNTVNIQLDTTDKIYVKFKYLNGDPKLVNNADTNLVVMRYR